MDNKSGIIEPENKPFVFSRHLPKTGQTVSYYVDDDGDSEAGWNIGERFIEKTISGDDIILDRATGLVWPKNQLGNGGNGGLLVAWSQAVIWGAGLNFAGWTDWRLPNILELISCMDYSRGGGGGGANAWHTVFANTNTQQFWASTTLRTPTANAWLLGGVTGTATAAPKTQQKRSLAVRGGRLG